MKIEKRAFIQWQIGAMPLRVSDFQFPCSNFHFPTSIFRFPNFHFPTSIFNFQFPFFDFQLPFSISILNASLVLYNTRQGLSGCGEQEVGVASGSGWNLWVWLLGVVVRRYIDFVILLIPTPLVSVLFCSSIPTFCSFKKKCFSSCSSTFLKLHFSY